MNENKQLGAQIKALRLSRNESQIEFGKNFFPVAARGVVSRWESGKVVPTAERLAKIAEMSGKSVSELLHGTVSGKISQIVEALSKLLDTPNFDPHDLMTNLSSGKSKSKDKEEREFENFAFEFFGYIFSDKYLTKKSLQSADAKENAIKGINYCARKVSEVAKEINAQAFQTELLYKLFTKEAEAHFAEETRTNKGLFNLAMLSVEDIYVNKIPKLLYGKRQNDGNSVELPNSINKKYLQELEKILENCENEIYCLGVKYGIYKDDE